MLCPVTCISPGKRLIYLNMSMAHMHELNGDAANDTPTDEGSEVAQENMVFVFRDAVVHLDRQVMDERLLPDRDVLQE